MAKEEKGREAEKAARKSSLLLLLPTASDLAGWEVIIHEKAEPEALELKLSCL
jgi:hypothetical protein